MKSKSPCSTWLPLLGNLGSGKGSNKCCLTRDFDCSISGAGLQWPAHKYHEEVVSAVCCMSLTKKTSHAVFDADDGARPAACICDTAAHRSEAGTVGSVMWEVKVHVMHGCTLDIFGQVLTDRLRLTNNSAGLAVTPCSNEILHEVSCQVILVLAFLDGAGLSSINAASCPPAVHVQVLLSQCSYEAQLLLSTSCHTCLNKQYSLYACHQGT